MRQPSTPEQRWAWWERAIEGEAPPVNEDSPQAGFFAIRKFSYGAWTKGPYVPARLWWEDGEIDPDTGELMSDERLCGEIDGVRINPWRRWTWLAKRPIPLSEYEWLRAQSPLLPTTVPKRRA